MKRFMLGFSKGYIDVEDTETVCNVILASEEAVDEIASNSRKILSRNKKQIQAVIDEKKYLELCCKHGIGNGFRL